MNRLLGQVVRIAGAALVLFLAPWGLADESRISFQRHIAPILAAKCLSCHGPEKAKGAFRLHTFEHLTKPGDSGQPAIVPGRPEQSELYRLITTADEDDRMPQKDDPLSPDQAALIERWISQGATFDGTDPAAPLIALAGPRSHPSAPRAYPRPVPITAIAFSPDGNELAAGGYHEITFWDPATGELRARAGNLPRQVQALAYSPDGSRLAAAAGTPGLVGEAVLIDPAQRQVVRALDTIPDIMLAICFSPDGTLIAAGGTDNSIRVYDAGSGDRRLLIEPHADWVTALSFSGDGKRIISASRDGSARLFDSAAGEMTGAYLGHDDALFAAVFTRDGKAALSGGRSAKLHVWDPTEEKKLGEIAGFEAAVLKLAIMGDFLLSCSADGTVRQHRLQTRELVRSYPPISDWVHTLAVHEPTGRVAAGSHDGQIRIWDTRDGRLLAVFIAAPGYIPAERN